MMGFNSNDMIILLHLRAEFNSGGNPQAKSNNTSNVHLVLLVDEYRAEHGPKMVINYSVLVHGINSRLEDANANGI